MTSVEELLRNAIACFETALRLAPKFAEAAMNLGNTLREIRTARNRQVRQPIYSRSVGRWEHYAQWIDALEKELRDPDTAEEPAGPST